MGDAAGAGVGSDAAGAGAGVAGATAGVSLCGVALGWTAGAGRGDSVVVFAESGVASAPVKVSAAVARTMSLVDVPVITPDAKFCVKSRAML